MAEKIELKRNEEFFLEGIDLYSVEFERSDDFIADDGIDVPLTCSLELQYPEDESFTTEARLFVTIDLFKDVESWENKPFEASIKMVGYCSWEDSLDKESLKKYLSINAASVVYSYARPLLSQLTVASDIAPLVLPLINFPESINVGELRDI